jgi:hypothetical protein
MTFKKGVNPIGLRTELLLALIVANDVYKEHEQNLVITSLNDGVHSLTSLHYSGCGADLRTRYFNGPKEVRRVFNKLENRLTKDYDIVIEKDHIHIEYQPKRLNA